MPRRSRADVERSQATLLEHATQLASSEGLEALTLGRVAEFAGLSKSGVIGRFGTKEALQLATVQAGIDVVVEKAFAPAMDAEPGRARLEALVEHYLDYLEAEVFQGGCIIAAASYEMDGRPGPVRDAIRDAWARWLRLLAREARAAGLADPEQVAFELHAATMTANWSYQLFGDREAFARARRAAYAVLDRG